jgi:hypothetical protein
LSTKYRRWKKCHSAAISIVVTKVPLLEEVPFSSNFNCCHQSTVVGRSVIQQQFQFLSTKYRRWKKCHSAAISIVVTKVPLLEEVSFSSNFNFCQQSTVVGRSVIQQQLQLLSPQYRRVSPKGACRPTYIVRWECTQ